MNTSTANHSDNKNTPRYWLLTWNPKHFQEGGEAGVEVGVATRWSCHSKQPQTGDIFYLVRLGEDPHGLIARGVVTQASFQDADWRHPEIQRSYIGITAEETRADCVAGLLSILLLQQISRKNHFNWSPQNSGVEITAALAKQVDQLWEAGRGKHSLQQYITWSTSDPDERSPDWLHTYQSRLSEATALQEKRLTLDESALQWIWRDAHNGISSVKPGQMRTVEFESNLDFLRSLTEQITTDQSVTLYSNVITQWQGAKEAGKIDRVLSSVIHRVFSAFAPERYCSITSNKGCIALLKCFSTHFQLPNRTDGSWAELNAEIMRCLQISSARAGGAAETNIALWRLYEVQNSLPSLQHQGDEHPADTDIEESLVMDTTLPHNRILYGPPGTGKTYETIHATLQILNPAAAAYKQVDQDDESTPDQRLAARAELKARFDELAAEQRVRFVTFHQSFSYEDFVEGLRAETVNGQVQYRVEAGVFKQICDDASATPESVNLSALLDTFIEQVAEEPQLLHTATGKQFLVSYGEGNTTLTCEPQASKSAISLPANIEYIRAVLAGQRVDKLYCASYVKGIAEHIRKQLPSPAANLVPSAAGLPHVLIIDEINRGNISRIFGELITLIEPSKRAGADEALSVTLPYSKETFSVPDNVYIIGTMNTADRSLAGLDLALRRRFSFTEMPPRPELLDGVVVDGVNIGQMLRVMNQRITVLLGRDHTLGHAYFMPLQTAPTLSGLADIFRQKILPLLQEYFFEDWERIRWVLNDQTKPDSVAFIIEDKSLDVSALFQGVADKLRQSPQWVLNDKAFAQADAYRGIAANLGKGEV